VCLCGCVSFLPGEAEASTNYEIPDTRQQGKEGDGKKEGREGTRGTERKKERERVSEREGRGKKENRGMFLVIG